VRQAKRVSFIQKKTDCNPIGIIISKFFVIVRKMRICLSCSRILAPSMNQNHEKPLLFDPRNVNSVRLGCRSAPPDTRRVSERDPGTPYAWNSVKVLDARIKAELGGKIARRLARDCNTKVEFSKLLSPKV